MRNLRKVKKIDKKIKVFINPRTNALRSFFICLFLVLLYIQQSTAQVDPKLTAKIKTALISKPWPIYVTYQQMVKGTIKSSVEEDFLTFTEGAVLSSSLSAQGYSKDGSGYKVKIGPAGDTYIWESIMLHKNQKDIVLLKGELKNGVMKGVIVYQPQGKPSKIGNFITIPPQ